MNVVMLIGGPHDGRLLSIRGAPKELWFRHPEGIIEDGKVLACEYKLYSMSQLKGKTFATYDYRHDRVRAESLVREIEHD